MNIVGSGLIAKAPAANFAAIRASQALLSSSTKLVQIVADHLCVLNLSQNLANKDTQKQVGIFAALISRLKATGAQVAAVTSMGGHFCIGELLPISTIAHSEWYPGSGRSRNAG